MNYTKEQLNVIVADSFKQLNYKQKKLFLASVRAENADRDKYAEAVSKICGRSVYNKLKENFLDEEYRQRTLKNLERAGVFCITVKCEGYPQALRETPAPPLVLYAKGNAQLLKGRMFAVVGSRKTSQSVLEECRRTSERLSEKLVIVTGVADGADSAAARGALASGNIICVLPGGHGSSCAANRDLLKKVENCGLSISEFTPGSSAQRYTFFLRNRIIAGLCEGVLVVSAAEKSGALNTATYAADYSRDVFAFPYSPGIESGKGCNALIKKGAALCEGADDIFTALGIEPVKSEEISLEPDEKAVMDILKEYGQLHAEKLAALSGKTLSEITITCAMLEIKGLVVKAPGNTYAAVAAVA